MYATNENMDGDLTGKSIIKILVYIKQNMTSYDTILDILVSKEIIGLHETSDFSSHEISHNNKIQEVINVVLKKGASDEFITALLDSGNEHVAEQILTLDEKGKNTTNDLKYDFWINVRLIVYNYNFMNIDFDKLRFLEKEKKAVVNLRSYIFVFRIYRKTKNKDRIQFCIDVLINNLPI